jgi:hypothetical protein
MKLLRILCLFFFFLCFFIIFIQGSTPHLLIGGKTAIGPLLVYSFHYSIFAGISLSHLSTQYEMLIGYGESSFNAVWYENNWRGEFLYGELNYKSYSEEKRSHFLGLTYSNFLRLGAFGVLRSKYHEKYLSDKSMGPLPMGFQFGYGVTVGKLSGEYYYSFGGETYIGVGLGLSFTVF